MPQPINQDNYPAYYKKLYKDRIAAPYPKFEVSTVKVASGAFIWTNFKHVLINEYLYPVKRLFLCIIAYLADLHKEYQSKQDYKKLLRELNGSRKDVP